MTLGLPDERPHAPSDDPRWVEAWLFDAVQADGSLAMTIEYLRWPQHGRVAFHASVVRPDEPLVSLVELDAVSPPVPSLEVRAPGLWTDIGIQTAGDHMTVDIEAFAVGLEHPDDVFDGAYGHRTALGCELEWETDPLPDAVRGDAHYELPCVVHGELLLAELTIEVDGWGWRSHRWGPPRASDRCRVRGRTADGAWFTTNQVDPIEASQVAWAAPVPDPSIDGRLYQHFVTSSAGDMAWVRTAGVD